MNAEHEPVCLCPLKGVIDIISKKWALLIINAIGNCGKLRFNKLMEELHGVSPKILSYTLKQLQEEGLIERESFAEIPPRVEYSLTRDGKELRKSIVPILTWAASRAAIDKNRCEPTYCRMPAHQIRNAAVKDEAHE